MIGTHKILWDSEIQTDHLIVTKRQDLAIINNNKKKKTCCLVSFTISVDRRVKIKKSKKRDKYLNLAREQKKYVEYEGDSDTSSSWCTWNSL